jgi:hypothetical protein
MLSVFLVVTVEMFFASHGAAHVHVKDYNELISGVDATETRNERKHVGRDDYISLSNQDQGMQMCATCVVSNNEIMISRKLMNHKHSLEREFNTVAKKFYKPGPFSRG